jgi:hypothetical protein
LDGPWCFAGCKQQEIRISLNTTSDVIALKSLSDETGLQQAPGTLDPGQLATIHDERTGNAVFLGRGSFSAQCTGNNPDDRMPFGCDLLKRVASGDLKTVIGVPISALTAVNIRRGPPLPGVGGSSTYQCSVGTLLPRNPLKLSSVTTTQEGGDSYFWGTIEGKALDCDGSPLNEAHGTDAVSVGIKDPKLVAITDQLNADVTPTRRAARVELSKYLSNSDSKTLEQLTDGIEKKSYRYQLGVAVGLADSRSQIPPKVQQDLTNLLQHTRDPTLTNVINNIVR